MSWIDWLIMTIPMIFVLYMGFYTRRYIRGISDFLAAGRVAGRYVLTVGNAAQALAVISLIGFAEARYKTGFAMNFWNNILTPLGIVLGLTGFVNYRFRETKALSLGQFLEMRYNRKLRIFGAGLRSLTELIANCLCPAIAARFMIYYIGLPPAVTLFGAEIPSFFILASVMVTLCVIVCNVGGCLSLMITDTIQGFFCYPLLIVFTVFIAVKFSWSEVVVPVMSDHVAGQSFLNPYDIAALRDFNMFALVVTIYDSVMNRGNWQGTSAEIAARSPHEQKMAGVMATWRNMFGGVIYILLIVVVLSTLNHERFARQGKIIRDDLSRKVLQEVGRGNAPLQEKINRKLAALPPRDHIIGGTRPQDQPLSHDRNLDTPHLHLVRDELQTVPGGAKKYQEFFTLYHQMMLPVTLRHVLPVGMIGLFALFIMLMMLSTDDSRLFSAAQTITQDCIIPFMKKGFSMTVHVRILRSVIVFCGVFWLTGSLFMAQLDYINMFVTIICAMWIGAGPIMIFGLYSRFGNTTGAFASLLTGMGLALFFICCQRTWASTIYPFLAANDLHTAAGNFLAACSAPFEPWIVWRINPHKFPINSYEINFIIMILCLFAYVAGSLLTFREKFNLDRMLHRGIYNTDGENKSQFRWGFRTVFQKLIGITPDYTAMDKVITWSVFIYSFFYKFLCCFILVVVWNIFSPWPLAWWGNYFYAVYLAVPFVAALITTVWFVWGGISDMRRMFRDLRARVGVDHLDNGQVEGSVSLSDAALFAKKEEEEKARRS
ncbi:MAG: sodium:panthothenate symporter [Lentisphaeria bacterium]|nr:sodium:panthothenate symporter [Lentisphaeria bacterium]